MAVNKLLVAFDESEGADRALAMAASLAAVNPEASRRPSGLRKTSE